MALLFISTGGLNSATAGVEFPVVTTPFAISTTTTRPNSDGHSIRINAGNGFARLDMYSANQTGTAYIGVAIYINSAVNASTQLIRWSNVSNTSVGNITLTATNTLVLLNSAGAQIGSASSALSVQTWYYVELKITAPSNPGTLEGRLNGSVFATGNNSNQGSFGRALFGTITGTQTTSDIFFTDIKVNDSTGTSYNSYPGSGNVLIVHPNGAGESSGWTIGGSAPAATNWQSVNEVPPNDAVTLVSESLLGDVDLYTVGSTGLTSTATINAVAVGGRFNNGTTADPTTNFQFEIEKTNAGTKLQSASITPNTTTWSTNSVAAPFTYPLVAYKDPDGVAWVGGGTLDTMRIGMISGTVGITSVQVTNIWAYVDYTPGVGTVNPHLLSLIGAGS